MFIRLFVCTIIIINHSASNQEYCDATSQQCNYNKRYLYYDVNPPEGFNLRRDVYMRLAIMISNAQRNEKKLNWNLVLPPWYGLYHWRAESYYEAKPMLWGAFFDIDPLKSFAPVLELYEVFDIEHSKLLKLDRLYVLQNFPDAFENGEFKEKWEVNSSKQCVYGGRFWGYTNVTAGEVICVKFQGKASTLWELLSLHPNDKHVMIAHAEIPLHDNYGDKQYWKCRKSMKFNKELVSLAKAYMLSEFNCLEKCDHYICVHWRRQDFSKSRYNEAPSVKGTADQVNKLIKAYDPNIDKVFIATDADVNELDALISNLKRLNLNVYYYTPTEVVLMKHKDGGVAIVEQIICSHSAYFVGTHESTFSFRIQEEREILGYPSGRTFNRLCPDSGPCEQPSKWKIVN